MSSSPSPSSPSSTVVAANQAFTLTLLGGCQYELSVHTSADGPNRERAQRLYGLLVLMLGYAYHHVVGDTLRFTAERVAPLCVLPSSKAGSSCALRVDATRLAQDLAKQVELAAIRFRFGWLGLQPEDVVCVDDHYLVFSADYLAFFAPQSRTSQSSDRGGDQMLLLEPVDAPLFGNPELHAALHGAKTLPALLPHSASFYSIGLFVCACLARVDPPAPMNEEGQDQVEHQGQDEHQGPRAHGFRPLLPPEWADTKVGAFVQRCLDPVPDDRFLLLI